MVIPHPVDRLTDDELRDLLLRVDTTGFPGGVEHLWAGQSERYRETCRRIPPAGGANRALLDLGSSRRWLPFFQVLLGYRRIVLNTAYPEAHFVDDGLTVEGDGPADVRVFVFNVERDPFPFDDASFDVVLCLEVLEHLAIDPMAMMAEVNRVLKPGGSFVLSTPNAVRCGNVVNAMLGEHPLGWAPYNGHDGNRHNREYTPREVDLLFRAAGITPTEVTSFGAKRRGIRRRLLEGATSVALRSLPGCPAKWRRDTILAAGRKTSAPVDRRPAWLYFELSERVVEAGLRS